MICKDSVIPAAAQRRAGTTQDADASCGPGSTLRAVWDDGKGGAA